MKKKIVHYDKITSMEERKDNGLSKVIVWDFELKNVLAELYLPTSTCKMKTEKFNEVLKAKLKRDFFIDFNENSFNMDLVP